jgi:hypothetical protein
VECREYSRVCPTVVPDLFDYKFSPGDDDADSKIESQWQWLCDISQYVVLI